MLSSRCWPGVPFPCRRAVVARGIQEVARSGGNMTVVGTRETDGRWECEARLRGCPLARGLEKGLGVLLVVCSLEAWR